MASALISHPSDEAAELLMGKQCFDGMIMPAEFFFAGDQIMDRAVTIAANRDRFLHLLSRKSLLEPFILVAGAGD